MRDMRQVTDGTHPGAGASASKPVFSLGIKDADIPPDPRGMLRRDLCMCILSEMLFSC